jgi:hypothetical protein
MGIRAAEAEGADPRNPRLGAPGSHRLRHLRGDVAEADERIDRLEMQVRGHLAVLQREHRFDEARHPCGRLEVADVGLHRAEEQRPFPTLGEDRRQRAHLDGVAERGSSAVSLDQAHVGRRKACARERIAEQPHLSSLVGRGQPVAAPVLVDSRATDDREHVVAGDDDVCEPLEDHDPAAFAPDVAIGRRVERLAAPICRKGAELAEIHRGLR